MDVGEGDQPGLEKDNTYLLFLIAFLSSFLT